MKLGSERTILSSLGIALILFLAALAARWPFILVGHTLLHSDEAVVGCMAQDIATGLRYPLYFYGQAYMGALEAYVIALLRPAFSDPHISLRLGPALFLALAVALQFLLLQKFFGRLPAILGAASLIAAPPALMQWSIAPRGAYIQSIVWGTMIWLLYWQAFVPSAAPNQSQATRRKSSQFLFGLLLGSGLWLNPTVLILTIPVAFHFILDPQRQALWQAAGIRWTGALLDRSAGRQPLQLPLLALISLFLVTCLWTVRINPDGVAHEVFFGWPPPVLQLLILLLCFSAAFFVILRYTSLPRNWHRYIRSGSYLISGLVIGHLPVLLYTLQRLMAGLENEDTLPLGPRPFWALPETIYFFIRGLPILMGADAVPYLTLAEMGREATVLELSAKGAAFAAALNWLLLVIGAVLIISLLFRARPELSDFFKLKARTYSPLVFLLSGLALFITFYLFSGAAFSFTSIRYLVPAWIYIPGLIAAAAQTQALRGLVVLLLSLWLSGQVLLYKQLGAPHSLQPLAELLLTEDIAEPLYAEMLDAHLLRFLTQQRLPILEWDPAWSRFPHLTAPAAADQAYYLVAVNDRDWSKPWRQAAFPGDAPIETNRNLWPKIQELQQKGAIAILSRHPLGVLDYEIMLISPPLPH